MATCLGPCSGSCGVLRVGPLAAAWCGCPYTRPASRAAGLPSSPVGRSSVHFSRCLLILFAKDCCQKCHTLSHSALTVSPLSPPSGKNTPITEKSIL